jgi:SAM-dependent methyltransferase
MDWEKYWNQNPNKFGETEFLKQVDKTVSGQPISSVLFDAYISDIRKALDVNKTDLVLDMCCGNGIITAEISKGCHSIVGVDYSEPLIKIAKKYNCPTNASYFQMSIFDHDFKRRIDWSFTKIFMYDALQHFKENELTRILKLIWEISTTNSVVFLGGIPDMDKLWDFYDTEERREDYRIRKEKDQEAIGTWWKRENVIGACVQSGFDCEVLSQNPLLHSAHYRFDVRLARRHR